MGSLRSWWTLWAGATLLWGLLQEEKPTCQGVQCPPSQLCQVAGGKARCVPVSVATCRAQGDPHYTTFDGRRYDMMGTCSYTMAELYSEDQTLPAFSVEAKNEHRGSRRVSYVGFVTVRAYSHSVSLARGEVGFVRIDSQRSRLPASLAEGRLRVYQTLSCPANSRYEVCGPACPPSCNPAAAPANCSGLPCVEGCACLPGFVASGGACVAAASCGCTYQGRPLAPGQQVWGDEQCRRRCTCDGATQRVSCSDTQGCPTGERCRVQNGLLGCYPDSFGSCQASGDPHYVSFDGRRFDFMGTCTYLLAGSCGQNAMLPAFRVLMENEHRGSQTVSYARAVLVEARGVKVAVRRKHPGQVLVDDVLQYLPFQAADGQVQVFRQGRDAVVRTDFGLTVTYDWNARVTVKVPSSYAGALCGLCGNFNGNSRDDLALRAGGQAANALAFGKSWQEETRPGCGTTEPGDCPKLDSLVAQQLQSKNECGILADSEGPFRECHDTLDPQGAVRDCAYDLCLLPGQSGPLCDALAAYADACQAAGATVHPWRSEKICPLSCPPHSHYEACSRGCPLSCGDLPVPGGCGSACHEGCVCDEGFALSGESCVPLPSCGCVYQGTYHPPGQTFYPGPGCDALCECQEGGLVSCKPSTCGPHEACQPSGGILGCVAVGSATCRVDGVDMKPPVVLAQGRVRVSQHGSDFVIETDFGLRVAYDLVYNVRVTVPGNYYQQLCGLCGNYNGDPKDDFRKPDGSQAGSPNEFGNSWEVKVPGSPCLPPPTCKPGEDCGLQCGPALQEKYQQEKFCGLLTSPTGPLAACHKLLDPQGPLKDCVFDLCVGGGNRSILCSNIHAYVSACQAIGGHVGPWRNESFCPMMCPTNSHYELCADTCSLSCSALSAAPQCPDSCAEGCQCDHGFLNDGQACVPIQKCGCYHNGVYYEPGQTVLLDSCRQQCVCHAGKGLACQNHSCELGQLCQSSAGILSCVKEPCHGVTCRPQETCQEKGSQGVCVPNYEATCWLWGDPHYHSFDGRDFDFQGTCNYVLVTTSCPGVTTEDLTTFTITTKNENRGNPAVSFVRLVTVTVLSINISIHKGEVGKVRVNGVLTALPVSVAGGRLSVTQGALKAVLAADFGLRVSYDWNWRVEVTLPSSYHGAVCGLCGNMDRSPSNDQAFPNGTLAPAIPIWGGSWRAPGWDPLCWDECQGSCPTCPEDQLEKYKGPGFCGPLAAGMGGPFAACHAHVAPDSFFKGCVLDVCLGSGAHDILCQALATYAAACQAAGIVIKDWRAQAGCEIACPSNSHYELCGPPCPASCPSPAPLTTPVPCDGPCAEGCQCDSGFVLSCVPGPCPAPCTPEQQKPFGGPDACGVISAPDGPLAPCHGLVPPAQYFQACLLDACQVQGHPGGLCPAVATYVAACQAAGAQLGEWRRPDFCPLQCPAHSHYEVCGDSCPVSCPSLSVPEGCKPACREGCVCDAGFVLSGDTCVPVGQCGCLHEGHYYPLGEAFYPGPQCEWRCECGPGGQVSCQEGTACRPYEECRIEDGVQACHSPGCGRCLANGGIHYVTLDGRAYDLHGSCSYVLAQVCHPQPEDEDFAIVLEKNAAGDPQRLLVTVAGQVVSLAKGPQVTVDGETVALPVAVGHVRVTAEGRNMVLQTTKKLRLLFDGDAHVLISIPSSFRGRLCGLCGNFNGNWSDDFVLPSGIVAPSVYAFGAAWRAPSSSQGCGEGCGPQGCPVCFAEETAPYESVKVCGQLKDPQGPFVACHAALSPSEYFRQCVYDMCAQKGNSTFLCRSLAAYTAACQAAGMAVKPWRTDSFCPLQCPTHSHYSVCTRSCPGSCAALSGLMGCTSRCFEGCECDDHFLLSQGICVPVQDCGCTHDGRYLPVNSSLLSSDCTERCSCSPSTGLTCQATGCPLGHVCEVEAGARDCWVPPSLCTLSVGTNLTTFDGAHSPGSSTASADGPFLTIRVCSRSASQS
ncbi:IgGFc-binding protein [Pteropus vampyrus]|uniref:IgGFc-binding protein n=1 Tax=Pteropus vampyrus TaxID=132908 RepID=A0A6P6D2A4_PTEVA|nr:IgGFc-binding protein [Pteropus vampyrus]